MNADLVPMDQCPRFDRCSAPICPLDPNWSRSAHLNGERVCFWLVESVKVGGPARIRGVLPTQVAEAVLSAAPGIMDRYSTIQRALNAASTTGSRLESGARLAATRREKIGTADRANEVAA